MTPVWSTTLNLEFIDLFDGPATITLYAQLFSYSRTACLIEFPMLGAEGSPFMIVNIVPLLELQTDSPLEITKWDPPL